MPILLPERHPMSTEPESNEPKQTPEGQTVYVAPPADGADIPLEPTEPPPVKLSIPDPDVEAAPPEPAPDPIDPGAIADDSNVGLV
jgi:hypothetical protein